MAWAVAERRTTATTRRVPAQRGHVKDVGLECPLEELGPEDGRPGTAGEYGLGLQRARGGPGPRWRFRRGGDDAGTHPSILRRPVAAELLGVLGLGGVRVRRAPGVRPSPAAGAG
jgi:hypothetical protein